MLSGRHSQHFLPTFRGVHPAAFLPSETCVPITHTSSDLDVVFPQARRGRPHHQRTESNTRDPKQSGVLLSALEIAITRPRRSMVACPSLADLSRGRHNGRRESRLLEATKAPIFAPSLATLSPFLKQSRKNRSSRRAHEQTWQAVFYSLEAHNQISHLARRHL